MMQNPQPGWRRRPAARPDEILDAALDEFQASGFEAARMQDIARRAGLSKAGVYLYFESKEALLRALILRAVKPVVDAAERASLAPGVSAEAALSMIVSLVQARLAEPRVFAIPWLVLTIAPRFPEIAAFYRSEVIDRARAALGAIIRRGIDAGEFRDVSVEAAVRAVMGPMMMGAILTHALKHAEPQPTAEEHVHLILQGLSQ